MQKSSKGGLLADKIASILSTTPSAFNVDDELVDETTAKLLPNDVEEEFDEKEEEIYSNLRKQNINFLADIDDKYKGKKVSRTQFDLANENNSIKSSENDLSSDDNEADEDDDDNDKGSQDDKRIDDEYSNKETEEEDSSDENEDYENDGDIVEETDNFKHISNTDVSSQIEKGVCVRNQMNTWELLLEMRIQLQKCLITSNKMPQHDLYHELKKESGPQFINKVVETKKILGSLLDKFLHLQKLIIKKYPETRNLDKKDNLENNDNGEEEIPSDTDDEKSEDYEIEREEEENEECEAPQKKIRKLNFYENELNVHFTKYKNYCNNVIQKWNDKTRLISKSTTPVHSVLNQIEHNLRDKQKLIKKTQTRRSQYNILGEVDAVDANLVEECNTEIYDDDDFYHQLLRELIEVKSANLTDPIQLGRQWIQLQNLRSKMKRKIDTKATKGRKIRYAVHSKLVNFMAPHDLGIWSDDAKTELYKSLFREH